MSSVERNPHVLGRRVGAFLIDVVLVLAPVALLFLAIAKSAPSGTAESFSVYAQVSINGSQRYVAGSQVGLLGVVWVLAVLVTFVLLPARAGASPGMGLLGLRVVGEDGGRVSLGRHLGRTAMWVADGFPYIIPGGVAVVTALTNPRRQRVGDLVAHTMVVRARSRPGS